MNSEGVGVCLNVLTSHTDTHEDIRQLEAPAAGVPVHMLLRICLDSVSLDTAVGAVHEAPRCRDTQSHFFIGNDDHEFVLVELNGALMDIANGPEIPALHTNHYLGFDIARNTKASDGTPLHMGSDNSLERFDRGAELIAEYAQARAARESEEELAEEELVADDVAFAKRLLCDRSSTVNPICAPFGQNPPLWGMDVGTVTGVVMELGGDGRKRAFHVTKGSPIAAGEHQVYEMGA